MVTCCIGVMIGAFAVNSPACLGGLVGQVDHRCRHRLTVMNRDVSADRRGTAAVVFPVFGADVLACLSARVLLSVGQAQQLVQGPPRVSVGRHSQEAGASQRTVQAPTCPSALVTERRLGAGTVRFTGPRLDPYELGLPARVGAHPHGCRATLVPQQKTPGHTSSGPAS